MKVIDLYRVTLTGLLVCTLNAYGQKGSNNVEQRVDSILSQMSLADKLSYIGGTGFFDVKAIPGVNLPLNPQLFQSDAGLGVRITPASVRYPAGPVLAATWNPDRARDLGAGLGRDTRARGFFTILGPGMDFYRTPFGGRNFEYATGEDPFLGSQLVPEVIKEIQEQGVWACAKHFVCNDQETPFCPGYEACSSAPIWLIHGCTSKLPPPCVTTMVCPSFTLDTFWISSS